jgi:8-oxo-dGTP pyrophosphatase MutT (NUDIX family)
MENKLDVISLVRKYLDRFENENHDDLLKFLDENELLFERTNFNGHITASAFIVDEARKEMLLLKHKLYDRFLQPGGHVEKEDTSILAASFREASEETGISKDELMHVFVDATGQIPIDIDSHDIPANPKKNEAAHVHHDFRYLFIYNGEKNITVPKSEAKDAKWVPLTQLAEKGIFVTVARKILKDSTLKKQ